jgi:hypothetical protein
MMLSVLAGLELVLLWIASSLLRGKGLVIAAAGLAALAVSLVAAVRGRRDWLYRLFFFTALAAGAVLGLEAILRLAPGILKGQLANQVRSGYHSEPDGIYVPDPYLGRAIRPGFARALYWNGHVWRHEANADGYRGKRLDRADAVFLGDSMVYGHGVETDETVPARFQARTGLAAANLGQQGTGPLQALELLRRKGLGLHPRYVFRCAHPTDVGDAPLAYDRGELQRFVEREGYRPLARPDQEPGVFQYWLAHVAIPLRAARALHGLTHRAPPPAAGPAIAQAGDARFLPSREYVSAPFVPLAEGSDPDTRLGWTVFRRAVAEIAQLARTAGAEVVVFDNGYPAAFSAAVEDVAREAGARYSDAGRVVLAAAQGGADLYLARDGHWSPAGCDAVAVRLSAQLSGASNGQTVQERPARSPLERVKTR